VRSWLYIPNQARHCGRARSPKHGPTTEENPAGQRCRAPRQPALPRPSSIAYYSCVRSSYLTAFSLLLIVVQLPTQRTSPSHQASRRAARANSQLPPVEPWAHQTVCELRGQAAHGTARAPLYSQLLRRAEGPWIPRPRWWETYDAPFFSRIFLALRRTYVYVYALNRT
jgi:hypothetical protein